MEYGPPKLQHDIMLIKLARNVEFTGKNLIEFKYTFYVRFDCEKLQSKKI